MAQQEATHLLPSSDLLICVDAWSVVIATTLCGHVGRLGNKESTLYSGPLRIVLDGHGSVYVGLVSTVPGEGSHHDTMR
jgi:hypothetical protein